MRNDRTPYHKRLARRLALSRSRQIRYQHNKYTQIDTFIVQFDRAYKEYYGVESNLMYARGWYYLQGRRLRHAGLERIMANLLAKLQEMDSPNPDREDV